MYGVDQVANGNIIAEKKQTIPLNIAKVSDRLGHYFGLLMFVIILANIQMFDSDKTKSKYELTLMTKLAQQTQRYEEMAELANKLLLLGEPLTAAERNLCSSAYKNLVNNRRAELKVLHAVGKKIGPKQTKQMAIVLNNYKTTIETELVNICLKIIKIAESGKIHMGSPEDQIFYLKLRADFYRYLCEVDDHEGKYFTLASQCYEKADSLARGNLPPTHEVRLSLHLNMSVFLYERCGEIQKALDLANRAFDEGVANVNETNEESFKNCTMILQLIRDNINLWSEEVDA